MKTRISLGIGFGAAILLWLALTAYAWKVRHDERGKVLKDVKIEKLQEENESQKEVITIRKKQNEIRNNRPDDSKLIERLRDGSF